MGTAVLCEQLAGACRFEPDRAYTAGLLHDVGLLGLMVSYPEEYGNLLAVSGEHGFALLQTEQAAFDIGFLAFLAQGYANATTDAQRAAILAQFNKILGYFTITGNTITFSYNEGAQTVTITDPTIIQIIRGTATTPPQPMPTDITAFNTWKNQTTPPGQPALTKCKVPCRR